MKLFDESMNPLEESQIDLENGYLVRSTVIKPGAAPIDNIHKFSWEDGDYEEIYIYTPKSKQEPSEVETLQAQVDELQEALNLLLAERNMQTLPLKES